MQCRVGQCSVFVSAAWCSQPVAGDEVQGFGQSIRLTLRRLEHVPSFAFGAGCGSYSDASK